MTNAAASAASVGLGRSPTDAAVHSRFYWAMAALLLLIVLLGFSRSFFLRPLFDEQGVDLWWAYLHGTLMSVWYLFFFAQTTLVVMGRRDLHRRLGPIGATFGLAAFVGTAYASWLLLPTATQRGFDVTNDATLPGAAALFWGNIGVVVVFAVLMSLAIYFRKRPEFHKRFMLFTFISTVTPAIARLTGPEILDLPGSIAVRNTVGVSLLVAAVIAHELLSRRRIHTVTICCVVLLFVQRVIFSFTIPATDFGLAIARTLRLSGTL